MSVHTHWSVHEQKPKIQRHSIVPLTPLPPFSSRALSQRNLDKKDWFGKSDPFLVSVHAPHHALLPPAIAPVSLILRMQRGRGFLGLHASMRRFWIKRKARRTNASFIF